ncbi:hypothetical protein niasHT_008647 [Heterodera trifolii]|uniref:Uncharacterized protein n=1 Tax=Heterodera trifolii TaxID=157864 RepID=A0ABD2M4C4_9BILA
MSNSFFVFLPSNVTDYPDNQPNKFRVRLPKPLHFNGSWVCGLHSISYPYSWSTIGTLDDQWIDIHFTDRRASDEDRQRVIRVPVPRASHSRVEQLRDFLTVTLRNHSGAKLLPLPREVEENRNRTKPLGSPPPLKREKRAASSPVINESGKQLDSPLLYDGKDQGGIDESPPHHEEDEEGTIEESPPHHEEEQGAIEESPPHYDETAKETVKTPVTPKVPTPPPVISPAKPTIVKTPAPPSDTTPAPPTTVKPPVTVPPPIVKPITPAPPPVTKPKTEPTPTVQPTTTPPPPSTKPTTVPPPIEKPKTVPPPAVQSTTTPPPSTQPTTIPPPTAKPTTPVPPLPAIKKVPSPSVKPTIPAPPAQLKSSTLSPKSKAPILPPPVSLSAKTIPKSQSSPSPPPESPPHFEEETTPVKPPVKPTITAPPAQLKSPSESQVKAQQLAKPSAPPSGSPPRFPTAILPPPPTSAAQIDPSRLIHTLAPPRIFFRTPPANVDPLTYVPNSVLILYEINIERFKVVFNEEIISHLSFSPQLGYVLGFENPQHVVSNEVAKYGYDLRGGISSFAVYSKGLTENIIIGNSLSSLLRVVSISGAIPGEYTEKIYDSPIFARVLPREINEIEIELRTMDKGRLVPFAYGTTMVVLIFKKVINF